jgi:SpoVK/Ycf46/Vps4 family AAA+-type ATPase
MRTISLPYSEDDLLSNMFKREIKKECGSKEIEGGWNGGPLRALVSREKAKGCLTTADSVLSSLAEVKQRRARRIEAEEQEQAPRPSDTIHFTRSDMLGLSAAELGNQSAALAELQQMVGMEEVKESVRQLLGHISLSERLEMEGKPALGTWPNRRCFIGPPGTGKTTAANLYARILKELGLLENDIVLEKRASDLIGYYVGVSEHLTKKAIQATRGGVLIIDDFHTILPDIMHNTHGSDVYRAAIIDTIVSNIDPNSQRKESVILVGYCQSMAEAFEKSNPGLARRFPLDQSFRFQPYGDVDLARILQLKLRKHNIAISDTAIRVAEEMLSIARHRPNFGNGGDVENLLQAAQAARNARCAQVAGDTELDMSLAPEDFDADWQRTMGATRRCADLFVDMEGMGDILGRFQRYQLMTTRLRARGHDPRLHIPWALVFRGSPGTGKTTVARKMAKIYYDMGFLSAPEVIECSVADLLSSYAAGSSKRVIRTFERALGKVLFIDEAYRLAESRSIEAIGEIVDCMTKERFFGKLVVVLAGYKEDMDGLMQLNRGLRSRFATNVDFKPMDAESALQLLQTHLAKVDIVLGGIEPDLVSRSRQMVLEVLAKLSRMKSWANGRDVIALSRAITEEVYVAGDRRHPPRAQSVDGGNGKGDDGTIAKNKGGQEKMVLHADDLILVLNRRLRSAREEDDEMTISGSPKQTKEETGNTIISPGAPPPHRRQAHPKSESTTERSPSAPVKWAVSLASATLLAELAVATLLWQIRMATFHYVLALPFLKVFVSGRLGYTIAMFLVVGNFILPWWKSRRSRHAVATGIKCGTSSAIWFVVTATLHHETSPLKQPELTAFIYWVYGHPLMALQPLAILIAGLPGLQGFFFRPLGALRRAEQRIWSTKRFAMKAFVDCMVQLLGGYYSSSWPKTNNRAKTKGYRYTAIDEPDAIRLLLIHPTLGSRHLKCSLVQARLPSAPRYEAISYCWGDSTAKHSITIEGQQLPLTESAFQVLRNRSSFWSPRLIWVDALCINQEDDDEKASQVQLMGQIYSQAYIVSVVLVQTLAEVKSVQSLAAVIGPELWQLLRRFYHALSATQMLDKLTVTGAELSSNDRAVTARLTPKTAVDGIQWVALRDLFNNPWFGRVWVVQEAALARRVRVLYNDFEIDWDTLLHAALAFGRFPALWTVLSSLESKVKRRPGGVGTVLSIHDYHDRISAGEVIPVSDLLFGIKNFQSTDPRDMVFAIHGMCSGLPRDLMKPRYGKTCVSEVYTNAAACLVAAGNANRMLSISGIGFRSPGATGATTARDLLPTWVPDWSVSIRSAQLSFLRPQIDYFAGGTTAQNVQIPHAPSLLSTAAGPLLLQGWITDRIVQVATPLESTEPDDQDVEPADAAKLFIDAVLSFFKTVQASPLTTEPYPHTDPPQSLREAYWRTLVGDRDDESRPASPSLAASFDKMVAFYGIIWENPNGWATLAARERLAAVQPDVAAFVLPLMRCMAGRRLCLTGKGMLGVVPPFSALGDEIAVFQGMQTPFLLRRARKGGSYPGECYQNVGECFIHGIMDSEVVRSGMQPRTIALI